MVAGGMEWLVAPQYWMARLVVQRLLGVVVVLTQLWLMASGNFAWLNVLTIALAATRTELTRSQRSTLCLREPARTHASTGRSGLRRKTR